MKKKHWDWLEKEISKPEHKYNIDYFLHHSYKPTCLYKHWDNFILKKIEVGNKNLLKHHKKVEKFISQLLRDLNKPDYVEKIPFWIHRINTIYASTNAFITKEFREFLKYLFIANLLRFSKNINRNAIPRTKISQDKFYFIEEQVQFTNKLKMMLPTSNIGKALKQLHQWSIIKDNWDGYGALPVEKEVLVFTKNFISNSQDFKNFECLYGNPQGTICLEFQRKMNKEKEISLNIEIGLNSISISQYEFIKDDIHLLLSLHFDKNFKSGLSLIDQIITNFNNRH